ncbi:hypothetical protein M3894_002927 [Vibrio metschnikovii]|nr:hypothetical protein [Vibrio metschnikovii]
MKLKQAWKHWSFKAAVFAAVLNGLLVLLAFYQYAFTPITYAAINVIISIAIAYLRIIPQKNL